MECLEHPQQILRWYLDAGVDEAIGEVPLDRYALASEALAQRAAQADALLKSAEAERAAQPSRASGARDGGISGAVAVRPAAGVVSDQQVKVALEAAAAAKNLDELRAALQAFDGGMLQKSATNLVFGDGNPQARIVFVGDVPGADEDRKGVPFVGPAGQLLDKMLASIGLDRTQAYVCNSVFWRPPGGRTPYPGEVAVCLPFVERVLELIDPALIVTLGGPAAHALLGQQGNVSKLVGRWFSFETPRMSHPIAASAIYHPEILLKTPAFKRETWKNLLEIRQKLDEIDA
ncbi:MAG TPA: uracil-DNA glycosylase [Magnetovibrio sp.]